MQNFVIVGGGLAAHQAAKSIIEMNVDARVSIVNAESQPAYDRPHLSKAFLAADDVELMYLAGSDLYADSRVRLMPGCSAVEIDRQRSHVLLEGGRAIGYDKLIVATGSRVRKLPGEIAEAPVLYLRTSADAMALRQRFVAGTHVVVIGGGFIGLEVAAAASKRNCNVTVLEAQATLLSRTASTMLSEWIYRLHVAQRINVHLNTTVERISQNASGKAALDTSAGLMTADFVVAGIGVVPNDELARGCGLQVENGIVVDSQCATVDPNVLAAGEVTSYHVAHLGTRVRSESWMAASEQGSVAGRVAAGDASADYAEMPWLWSDQFNSNIQCLGLPQMASKHTCIGDPDSNEWALLGWNADDRLVSAIAANRGRDVSAIRRAIRRGVPLPSQYTAAHPIASL